MVNYCVVNILSGQIRATRWRRNMPGAAKCWRSDNEGFVFAGAIPVLRSWDYRGNSQTAYFFFGLKLNR